MYITLYNMELPISQARARLPELAQRVMDSPNEVVYIQHRDRKERLVLTTETHIRMLETMVMNLRKQLAAVPFRLEGSLETSLSADELAAAIDAGRSAEAESAESRQRDLGG